MQKKVILSIVAFCAVGFFAFYIYKYMHSSSAKEPKLKTEKGPENVNENETTTVPTEEETSKSNLNKKTSSGSSLASSSTSSSSASSSSSSSSDSSSSSSNPTATPTPNPCASLSNSSYDNEILDDSPVLYLPFTESGSACDHSSKKYNGTESGSLPSTTMPNGDKALAFDGASSYVEVADNDDLSPSTTGRFTLEAWMRPDTLEFDNEEGSGYVHWMGKGTTNNQEYLARMYSYTNSESRPNRISGYAFNASGGLGVGSYFQDTVNVGEWIYYTLIINTVDVGSSYPTGYTKIYKNGAERDQDDLSSLSIVPSNGSAPFRIGTRDFASFFEGAIGKVAIYNYELTATQIFHHYRQMVPFVAGSSSFVENLGSSSTKAAGTKLYINLGSTVPSGDTIIVRVAQDYTSGAPTVTDSKGNTYTRDRTAPNSGNTMRASIYSSPISSALGVGDTITITTSSIAARVAVADHFKGLKTSSILDQQNGTSGSSSTPSTNISITTTQADDLIIGFTAVEGPNGDAFNQDELGEFNNLNRLGTSGGSDDTNITVNGGYKSVSVAGNYQYKPTLNPSRNWISFIASYKAL